jgi:hypothetical protein
MRWRAVCPIWKRNRKFVTWTPPFQAAGSLLGEKVFFATLKALEAEAGVEVPKPGGRKA